MIDVNSQMAVIIDWLALIILEFSHGTVIAPLLILGYTRISKKIFFNSACLVLLSMIFNVALKVTFQVPLPDFLNKEGFAFPSGHMQTSTGLYLYLYSCYRNIALKAALILLLALIGASLMHFGYHDIYDVIGAVLFSAAFIYIYKYCHNKFSKRNFYLIIMQFASICLFYIQLVNIIPDHIWISYCILLILLTLNYYFD